jgi:uncharacterized phage-associated protein
MLISHEKDKLFNAIIYFIKNTKYCYKTKLMKLLYYLDFIHFKETGKSVTGLTYKAFDFGPYPEELGKKISNNDPEVAAFIQIQKTKNDQTEIDQITFSAKRAFDGSFFTRREKRILEEVAFIFKDTKTADIVEASHLKNHPWDRTLREKGEREEIDYFLALDETSPPIEKIADDIEFKKALEKACG